MLSKFIFSLADLIVLLFVFVLLALEPVWNYLVGGGTPLKLPFFPHGLIDLYTTKHNATMSARHSGPGLSETANGGCKLIDKLFARGGAPYNANTGLPHRLGDTQCPSGQLA